MGSATVQAHQRSTGPHNRAEVAAETLARLSFGDLADAQVVRSGGHAMPASGFGRRDLLRRQRGGSGDFGIKTRLDFTRYPVLAILGGLGSQNVGAGR